MQRRFDTTNEQESNGGCSDNEFEFDDNNRKNRSTKLDQITFSLTDPGPLTCSLYNVLKDMNSSRSFSTISPGSLFSLVCKKYA